ncbi:MerR family transcriptional regulator [Olsenella sp. Marseille-P4559]|jgi:DNA-binding transcriptional MerR regulator|uniref:MerR family transcriptional regulator n=1 Tax=Olsenella sp. Marseille-P4559 TaxID=2364795 RepID=UPI00102F4198|nr:MerR family transcriptional regulator [Olsenella sp. Marseille-P4559]
MGKGLIKISEMAGLHGVSRQTLILYDKNGLLPPAYVSETGCRYYSADQIPRLRLICLLKEMGVTLAKIKEFLERPTQADMVGLVSDRIGEVDQRIAQLQLQREELVQFSEIFEHIETRRLNVDMPHVEWIPARRAVFSPYPSCEMDVKHLHLALMDAWNRIIGAGLIPSRGFGSLLWADKVRGDEPLEGAGSIVILPRTDMAEDLETIYLPEGDYAVIYKVAMPYDPEPIKRLLDWIDDQGLSPAGEVVDRCLLDAAFYNDAFGEDFCRLEVRLAC